MPKSRSHKELERAGRNEVSAEESVDAFISALNRGDRSGANFHKEIAKGHKGIEQRARKRAESIRADERRRRKKKNKK